MLSSTAMILGAGFGKRLLPLTNEIPKPLIEINGRPLIEHTLKLLKDLGFKEVVVNAHHLKEKLKNYLDSQNILKAHIIEESSILETGGGVKNALAFFEGKPFFVINGDIYLKPQSPFGLKNFIESFDPSYMKALLLCIHEKGALFRKEAADFALLDSKQITFSPPSTILKEYIFTGVQILFEKLYENSPDGTFSNVELYKKAAKEGTLFGYEYKGFWRDIGTLESLEKTRKYLNKHRIR